MVRLRQAVDAILDAPASALPSTTSRLPRALVRACLVIALYELPSYAAFAEMLHASPELRRFVGHRRLPTQRDLTRVRRVLFQTEELRRNWAFLVAIKHLGSFVLPSSSKTRELRVQELRDRLVRAHSTWKLTRRQLEVLELIVLGYDNGEVSDELGCAVGTVEVHVTHIFEKARATHRAGLVARFWLNL